MIMAEQAKPWKLRDCDFDPFFVGLTKYTKRTSGLGFSDRLFHAFPRAITLAAYDSALMTLPAAPFLYTAGYLMR